MYNDSVRTHVHPIESYDLQLTSQEITYLCCSLTCNSLIRLRLELPLSVTQSQALCQSLSLYVILFLSHAS